MFLHDQLKRFNLYRGIYPAIIPVGKHLIFSAFSVLDIRKNILRK